jgi:hypothetical protein
MVCGPSVLCRPLGSGCGSKIVPSLFSVRAAPETHLIVAEVRIHGKHSKHAKFVQDDRVPRRSSKGWQANEERQGHSRSAKLR